MKIDVSYGDDLQVFYSSEAAYGDDLQVFYSSEAATPLPPPPPNTPHTHTDG